MIQGLAFFGSDNTDRHLGRILALPGKLRPFLNLRLRRYSWRLKNLLKIHSQLIHWPVALPSSKES